jgi:PAS domain S-box-containing protein
VTEQTSEGRAGETLPSSRPDVHLWTCGRDGVCTDAAPPPASGPRPAARGMHRWPPPNAVHASDAERRRAVHRRAMERGEPFEVEYRLRDEAGDWRWMLERGVPSFDASGRCTGLAGAAFDVTRRRHAEQELLRSRENLRLALRAGNMGTWVWDRRTDRVVRDHNLQRLYGLDPDPAAGTFEEWITLVHPDDRARLLEEVARSVAEGGTYELEHRIVRPDGELRWLERRGEAYHDDSGEVAGTRGLVVDITDRKRAEEERDRLLAAEQAARRSAELAAGRLARLQAITSGLAEARTSTDVAEVVVVNVAEGLGAGSGAVCLVTDDGENLRVVRHVGYEERTIERFLTFPLDADLPPSEAARTGELVLLGSLRERNERYPVLREVPSRNESSASVPLTASGRPAGVIALGWPEPRCFDEDDRAFLVAVGQQAGSALDRAAFHEAEQERARRQSFLAEASRVLGSTLDHTAALSEVAALAVPTVADACSIHLVDDGELVPVAIEHVDGRGRGEAGPPSPLSCLGVAPILRVVEQGAPLLLGTMDDADGRAGAEADDAASALRRAGVRSALAVPIRAGDEALGVVVVAMGASGRRYRPTDVAFVEDLAGRAASAVVNGRSHQARTAIAHTLQRSLLPPEVPVLPGLEVAARYRPVGTDAEVGGDFYDVFATGGGRWGVVIGDVSGKGIAAASLTALARYTVKTAARWESSPSGVLDVLNKTVLDEGPAERFCTVALGLVRYGMDGVRIGLSCAGHPQPLLLGRDGSVRPVGEHGTAVGLVEHPRLADVTFTIDPGHTLVLFTDGVVEARSAEGRFADGVLEAALASCAGQPAEEVADAIERTLLEFVGGRPRDDTALLVIRRPPGSFHQHVVPSASSVVRARRRLQSWLEARLPDEPELVEDVVILANELTTNAERVARTAADVHVSIDDRRVLVDVSDDGAGFDALLPPVHPPPVDTPGGRGLHIVARLADDCAVRSASSGALVRCELLRGRRRR